MADAELIVEVDHSGVDEGIVVVRLRGEVDASTAPTLAGELQALIFTAAPRELVLDFGAVGFMDSSGLRVLIDVHKELRARDAVLVLEQVPETTAQLLEVTGLTSHLEIR